MISNKHFNKITVIIVAIAMVFALFITLYPSSSSVTTTTKSSTYVTKFLDKTSITDINIEVTEENWNYLLENAIDEEYVPVNITINGETFYNVGIRAKGNSSLSTIVRDDTTDRYSFKIKFNEYVKGQTLYGLEKLVLNNNYSDTTSMKEYLSYDLLTMMGVSTPAFAYTDLKVNGTTFGLYLAVETIEESFLERNYGTSEGNLYKPESMNLAGGKNENIKDNGFNNGNGASDIPTSGASKNVNNSNNNSEDSSSSNGHNGGGQNAPGNMPNNGDNSGGQNFPGNMPNNGDNSGGQNFPGNIPNNGDNSGGQNFPGNMPNKGDNSGGQNFPGNMPNNGDNSGSQNFPGNMPNNGDNFPGNMPNKGQGGMNGSSGGTNLVYTDDNADSYSTVLDSAVFKSTSDEDKAKVIDMIKNLNSGTNLEDYLNVDEILRYFAVNTFLVNLDSYASSMKHNYYLYERNGIFEILPWDYNMSFGGFQSGNSSSVINFPIDSPVTDTLENSPLIGKLLEVDQYKEQYHKYLSEIVQYVNNGTFSNTVDSVDKLISNYVKNDPTAFFTYDEYKNSLSEIHTFSIDRSKSILAQLNGTQPTTTYGNIETTLNLSALGSMGGAGGKDINIDGFKNNTKQQDSNSNDKAENTNGNNNNFAATPPNNNNNANINNNNKNIIINIENQSVTNMSLKNILIKNAPLFLKILFLLSFILYVLKFKRRKYYS